MASLFPWSMLWFSALSKTRGAKLIWLQQGHGCFSRAPVQAHTVRRAVATKSRAWWVPSVATKSPTKHCCNTNRAGAVRRRWITHPASCIQ